MKKSDVKAMVRALYIGLPILFLTRTFEPVMNLLLNDVVPAGWYGWVIVIEGMFIMVIVMMIGGAFLLLIILSLVKTSLYVLSTIERIGHWAFSEDEE